MSGDRARNVHVWLVDSGIVLHSHTAAPTASFDVTLNMKFAVSSKLTSKTNLAIHNIRLIDARFTSCAFKVLDS